MIDWLPIEVFIPFDARVEEEAITWCKTKCTGAHLYRRRFWENSGSGLYWMEFWFEDGGEAMLFKLRFAE